MRGSTSLLVAALLLALPATAGAATLHATPSTFASVYASAQGGDTVLLASGSYGSFSGAAKTGMVTVDEESGASASFSGSTFSAVRNLTLKNVTYTGSICINPPGPGTKMNLILDGLNMGNVGQGCGEGRITIRGGGGGTSAIDGNGVQIKNTVFGPGGCSDGIQDISNGTEIGPGNEFTGITQGNCAPAHVDSIQPYAANYTHIHDNYIHDSEQGIQSPDGVSVGYLIENNVIHTSTGYPCMHLGNTRNGTVRHNVCRNGGIRVYGGNQNTASQNMRVQDNISTGNDISACTGCTVDHNLNVSQVTFTGGTGRCAYATASPQGTASDGTDIGINDCGQSPPPPPPPAAQCADGADNDGDGFADYPADPGCSSATDDDETDIAPPPPPTDHQPTASFTATPEPSTVGQTVTFDATATTCDDTPCTYHWHDIGPDGTADYGLGPDGATMTFAFQGTGTKYVELVVTDADGDTDTVEHDHVVQAAPPPPPPPSLSMVAQAQTNWSSTAANQTTSSIAVQPGDLLVAYQGAEDSGSLGISSSYGLISWGTRQAYAGNSTHSAARILTATVPTGAPATITVTFSRSGTTGQHGGGVQVWRGSGGYGVSGQATGTSAAPSLTLAGVSANSAIVKFNVDWAAKSGASRNSRPVGTFTETTYSLTSQYTVYAGYHTSIGAAGSKTIGYTAPSNQNYTLLGVEVKGA